MSNLSYFLVALVIFRVAHLLFNVWTHDVGGALDDVVIVGLCIWLLVETDGRP